MKARMNADVQVLTAAPVIEIDGVKYHHHPNGGGLVAETAQVADTVYVGPCAKVCGHCKLDEDVVIFGNAWIYGWAEVSGSAQIFGDARIFGNAKVQDDAKVYGFARVHGAADISGYAEVSEKAEIGGNARIRGNARIIGNTRVLDELSLSAKDDSGFIGALLARLAS